MLGVLEQDGDRTWVGGTSEGTVPISDYAEIDVAPQLPHGVGAWLLAASEFLRPPGPRRVSPSR